MWSKSKQVNQRTHLEEKHSPSQMVTYIDECLDAIDKAYRKLGSIFGITEPKHLPDLIRLKEDWEKMKSENEHTPKHACDAMRMRLDSIFQDKCIQKPDFSQKINKELGDHHYYRLVALLSQDLHRKTNTFDVGWRSIEHVQTSPKYDKYPDLSKFLPPSENPKHEEGIRSHL